MRRFRRLALVVLLLTVPFQAAMGAGGMLCASADHHSQPASATPDGHRTAMSENHHAGSATHTHHDAAAEPGSHDPHGTAGKCKVCGESCCSAAAIPASPLVVLLPDSPLRVSAAVDPDLVSRSGDGLFRPPRTSAV